MTRSGFAFDRTRHDRAGHLRADDRWREADPRVMVLGGEHVATVDGPAVRWMGLAEAPEGTWIHLGEQDGRQHAAVVVDRVPADLAPVSLRVLAPLLGAAELSLAIHAVAMARWLGSHPFCPRCGAATEVRAAGHLRHCTSCGTDHFPRTDPAVIMLVTDAEDRALLGRQAAWPAGRFSTLAGFVEPGENLEDAVRREVAEEVGVTVGEVRYAASQPWPFPSSLMLGFFGVAETTEIVVDEHEIAEARWVTREELTVLGESGELVLPPPYVSISRWLIETWHGGSIPGHW
ncbi:hydrolase, NUDIX family [Aeromicrobium marinum DSM 15272]|uniref:NAD(+) diphosphatase n=1 Tax=Aeromicrobium marinum DSM 15272 TaxID=585531 RepID=E2SEA7_9ACTN|nr:NAD(+) diphosphatase [Aeromicrobium marinum]EFQ82834.1 hydrolase, NUDIX family [Aeromicrobium marinum DSM 15272]